MIKPLGKNILVRKLTREQLGKIVMPDSFQDSWLRGKVVSVGHDIEVDIKEGDTIIFQPGPPYLGGEYPAVGEEGLLIIPECYVWAIETEFPKFIKETENEC